MWHSLSFFDRASSKRTTPSISAEPLGVGELREPVQDRDHPGCPEVLEVDQPPQVGVVRGRITSVISRTSVVQK